MTARQPAAIIFAAGKLHTEQCAITVPNGRPVADVDAMTLATAKRCRTCNASSRRVAAIVADAQLTVHREDMAFREQRDAERRTVRVPSMIEPLRDHDGRPMYEATDDDGKTFLTYAPPAAHAPVGTPAPAAAADPAAADPALYAGERKCSDCGELKPITTFPTSTSSGTKVRLGYCRACRAVRATAKAATS